MTIQVYEVEKRDAKQVVRFSLFFWNFCQVIHEYWM
jgi:hypothetical protein